MKTSKHIETSQTNSNLCLLKKMITKSLFLIDVCHEEFLWKMSPKNGKTQISKEIMLLWDGDGGEWTGLGWSQRMKLFQRIPCVANFQVLQKIFSILLLLGKIRKSTQIPKGSFHFEILRWGSPDPSSTIDQNWKNFKRGRGIGTLRFCSKEGKLISYRSPIKKLKILGKTFFLTTHLSSTLTKFDPWKRSNFWRKIDWNIRRKVRLGVEQILKSKKISKQNLNAQI